uniref:Endoplasmic reticulum aminopeptidase 2 n=1 Tax=Cynoglossus semilaevis TaxID=244447 RepID=A0A3P8VTF6_CYNSE
HRELWPHPSSHVHNMQEKLQIHRNADLTGVGKNLSLYITHSDQYLQCDHEKHKGVLACTFGADIAEGFSGFYRNTYRTTAGETSNLAADGFEPFTFQTQVQHIALSNMPVVSLLEDRFAFSVKMSTYLVAFVICDFRSVSATTSEHTEVSIYAAPEKWTQTHYALDVAVKMLGFYEKYFNICYPLPKQDLIAIPDFQSGAMENWGLTTYRETSLLYDPLTSSLHDKLWVNMVIGHELAHQVRLFPSFWQVSSGAYLAKFCLSDIHRRELGKHCYTSEQATKNAYLFVGEHLNLTQRFLRMVMPSDLLWPSLQKGIHVGEEVSRVKVNTDMTGYYLVHYEDGGWDNMINLLRENHTALSYKDRTYLIHNAFQLYSCVFFCSAGHLPIHKALDLISFLQKETNTSYILTFFCQSTNQQTWSDEGTALQRRLRSEVLSLACHLNDPSCIQQAKSIFKDWLHSNGTLNLPTDVAQTVYSVGAQDNHGWKTLLRTYNFSLSEVLKDKILHALCHSTDISKLERLLELGLEGNVIRMQDLSHVVLMVARNPQGHQPEVGPLVLLQQPEVQVAQSLQHLAGSILKKQYQTQESLLLFVLVMQCVRLKYLIIVAVN